MQKIVYPPSKSEDGEYNVDIYTAVNHENGDVVITRHRLHMIQDQTVSWVKSMWLVTKMTINFENDALKACLFVNELKDGERSIEQIMDVGGRL